VAILIQRGKRHVFDQHEWTDSGPAAAAAVARPCFSLPQRIRLTPLLKHSPLTKAYSHPHRKRKIWLASGESRPGHFHFRWSAPVLLLENTAKNIVCTVNIRLYDTPTDTCSSGSSDTFSCRTGLGSLNLRAVGRFLRQTSAAYVLINARGVTRSQE